MPPRAACRPYLCGHLQHGQRVQRVAHELRQRQRRVLHRQELHLPRKEGGQAPRHQRQQRPARTRARAQARAGWVSIGRRSLRACAVTCMAGVVPCARSHGVGAAVKVEENDERLVGVAHARLVQQQAVQPNAARAGGAPGPGAWFVGCVGGRAPPHGRRGHGAHLPSLWSGAPRQPTRWAACPVRWLPVLAHMRCFNATRPWGQNHSLIASRGRHGASRREGLRLLRVPQRVRPARVGRLRRPYEAAALSQGQQAQHCSHSAPP